jgi:hypothetical protein
MSTTYVPLVISVELAGELLGVGRGAAYLLAQTGLIPTLPGRGRKKVVVAKLEAVLGRPLTADDIAQAEIRLAPKHSALLRYQAEYREARAKSGLAPAEA